MYHVGVSNIFELLDDENDEERGKKVPTQVRAPVKQDAAPVKKTNAPVTKDQPRKTDAAPAKGQFNKDRSERKPRQEGERPPRDRRPRPDGERVPREPRQPREPREPREPKEPREPTSDAPFDRTEKRERKDRDHGQFVKEGRPNKRIFDRKSGTGRGKEIKKGGAGQGNWGKEAGEKWEGNPEGAEEIVKIEGEPAETPAVPQETEEEKKFREEEEKKRAEEEEKEAKLMTLGDYLKKKQEAKAAAAIPDLPQVRQAGEGVDKKELNKWSTYTQLKKNLEDEEEKPESKKEKKQGKKTAAPAELLNFQAKKPERREKGSPKFNKGNTKKRTAPLPDVKDNSNFPALSTKA